MLLTIAAIAASLIAQDAPAPGQNKERGLLVGPAAERYEELLKKEQQLTVARAQMRLLATQVSLLQMLASSDQIDNAKRITAEREVAAAAEALKKANAEFLTFGKHGENCFVGFDQTAQCPKEDKK